MKEGEGNLKKNQQHKILKIAIHYKTDVFFYENSRLLDNKFCGANINFLLQLHDRYT